MADEVADWIYRDAPDGESQWFFDLSDWVRDMLAPRVAAGGQGP